MLSNAELRVLTCCNLCGGLGTMGRVQGELFGYLSNGIPHASINIPEEPLTPPAIRDSSVYLLSGGGV